MTTVHKLRCAIYTRKSSEEGLEQGFNSLHAQREACEAYVRSQTGEGWSVLKAAYDDSGYSGGSMDRPALRALMAEIEAGRIDVVVVYKVDRLTRSLMDFAKMVEAFDRKGVSFVSVTQSFNTTSSMGRLTLNVLLSFAQFEREVTGERIRDKVAASKAKGMWMGGNPALGYDIKDRKLIINPTEAVVVRRLFDRYLALGSVYALKAELDRDGVGTKRWVSRAGREIGGQAFSRGALFHVLKNRLFLGEIVHRGRAYPGEHEPIVSRELFDAVQAKLSEGSRVRKERSGPSASAPLKGLVFDQDGQPMSPTVSYGKGAKAFRYYVSAKLQQGVRRAADDAPVRRISAVQLEALVRERLAACGIEGDWPRIHDQLRRVELRESAVHIVFARRGDGEETEGSNLDPSDRLERDRDGRFRLMVMMRPVFRGGRTWLLNPAGAALTSKARIDASLVAALKKAHAKLAEHHADPNRSGADLLRASSPVNSYDRRLIELAFLAPDIQRAILEGRQPPGLTAQQLMTRRIPLAWADQRSAFGFAI